MQSLRVEVDTRDPVLVTLPTHDEFAHRHRPQLPGVVVTACGDETLLRVHSQRADRHHVSLESLAQYHRLCVGRLKAGPREGVHSIIAGQGGPGFFHTPLFFSVGRLRDRLLRLLVDRLQSLLQGLVLAEKPVSLQLEQHFFLHCVAVLFPQLVVFRLELKVQFVQFLDLSI